MSRAGAELARWCENFAGSGVAGLAGIVVGGGVGRGGLQGKKPRKHTATGANWAELEKKVGIGDKAFQRPLIRKKTDELAQYYSSCRESDAPSVIPDWSS
jgi:hypothetical protein